MWMKQNIKLKSSSMIILRGYLSWIIRGKGKGEYTMCTINRCAFLDANHKFQILEMEIPKPNADHAALIFISIKMEG